MNRHILLPLTVSLLALAFLDPIRVLMPEGLVWSLLAILFIVTSSYGLFVFTEKVDDEREIGIRSFSERVSCLAGMSLLMMSIIYRLSVDGHVYPEVIIILAVMVTAKSIAHWYACNHH